MKKVSLALFLAFVCHGVAMGYTNLAEGIRLGSSGACIVDRTLNYERFYYCGAQSTGCANREEGRNDIAFYVYDGDYFTTVGGWTGYCCGGTTAAMGQIQATPCDSATETDYPPAEPRSDDAVGGIGGGAGASLEVLRPDDAIGGGIRWGSAFSDLIEENAKQQDCPPGIRFGNNPENGKCIECPIGKYFNANNPSGGYCNVATVLTKTDLMYGYGQTRNSNTKLRNQCWHIKDPDKYRRCVLSGGNSATNSVLKVLLQHSIQQAETKPNVSVK